MIAREQRGSEPSRWAVMGWLSATASATGELVGLLVAPPRCAGCDASTAPLIAFCAACASTIERAADDTDGGVAAFVYGGAIARAIGRLKYDGRADLARPLGDLLARALTPRVASLADALVVPVPLHPSRLAERGFNQSGLIAARVARAIRAPLLALGLERARDTPRQATLDRAARMSNLSGAFRIRQPARIRGRRVLLIDDVCTTGATLAACARPLRDAGAVAVLHAVVARVVAPSTPGAL